MHRLALALAVLGLMGCENTPQAPAAPRVIQAQDSNQYGHIVPVKIPTGETFGEFVVLPSSPTEGKRFFFTTKYRRDKEYHVLRDEQGIPLMVVQGD